MISFPKQFAENSDLIAVDLSRINLNKLHAFFAVAGQGGVTRAAESLSLTRSAVSQSLAQLESQIGVQLFHRVGRNLVLTREGKRLHAAYDRYRQGLNEVLEELATDGEVVRGVIRLGMYVGFSHSKLTGAVSGFLARFPDVRIRMVFASARELERMLERNTVDFAFSIHPPSGKGSLRGTPLLEEELVLVAAPGLVAATGALECTPELIASLPVIDYYESRPLIELWYRHHFGASRTGRDAFRVRAFAATADAVLELVLGGAGAGVIPRRQAEPHLREGRLRLLGSGAPELSDPLWLNELDDSSRRPLHRFFRESVFETFRGEGGQP